MSVVEKSWQITRPTIKERSKFMFNNDLFSDVKFIIRKTDGESESKQVIPAHKFVLSISSPVFEAMFYGDLAETGDSIELPDCEYESLLELFRYMYSDEANLNGSNVMGVLYLAKKYIVPSLADKCLGFLQDNVNGTNVFSILSFAQKYEEKNLLDQCWKVIDDETEEAVKSEGFATIERSLLEAIVERDTLTIEEIELFKAVDLWATKKCEEQGLAVEGSIKRRILGEQIIKGIRFPTLRQEDFATVVLDSDMLTKEEIVSIIKYLSGVPMSSAGFPETKRSRFGGDIQRCCRLGSVSTTTCWKYDGTRDAINFSVDKDIVLHGVRFFGSENNSYDVDVDVMDSNSKLVLVSKNGQYSSDVLQSAKCSYRGFEVLFSRKTILKKNTMYDLWARITGPDTLYGVDCVSSVQCSGVTFSFRKSEYLFNATNIQQADVQLRVNAYGGIFDNGRVLPNMYRERILDLYDEGWGQRQISRELRKSVSYVNKVVSRYYEANTSLRPTKSHIESRKIDQDSLDFIEVQKLMKPSIYGREL
ncbi:hypothetical protein ACROYT_G008746 [Oculina patagonica]